MEVSDVTALSVEDVYAAVAPEPTSEVARVTPINESVLNCTLWDYQRQTIRWAIRREQAEESELGVQGGVIAEESKTRPHSNECEPTRRVHDRPAILQHVLPTVCSGPGQDCRDHGSHPKSFAR